MRGRMLRPMLSVISGASSGTLEWWRFLPGAYENDSRLEAVLVRQRAQVPALNR